MVLEMNEHSMIAFVSVGVALRLYLLNKRNGDWDFFSAYFCLAECLGLILTFEFVVFVFQVFRALSVLAS